MITRKIIGEQNAYPAEEKTKVRIRFKFTKRIRFRLGINRNFGWGPSGTAIDIVSIGLSFCFLSFFVCFRTLRLARSVELDQKKFLMIRFESKNEIEPPPWFYPVGWKQPNIPDIEDW